MLNWDIIEDLMRTSKPGEEPDIDNFFDMLYEPMPVFDMNKVTKIGMARKFELKNNQLSAEVTVRKSFRNSHFNISQDRNSGLFVIALDLTEESYDELFRN